MKRFARVLFSAPIFTVLLFAAADSFAVNDCVYSGVNFSDGAVSCQSGQQFRCSDGDWKPLDLPCAVPPPPPAVVNPAACACTDTELRDCNQQGQNCCVSMESGACVKRCCPK